MVILSMEEETPSKRFEVFLSFRGEDTRNTITSHIYKALCDRKVKTFKDDPDLRKGDEISPSLSKAIEESHISLVVFSKNYASSRWCLEELVEILQCKNKHRQVVIPVFYDVEPTEVRNQTGSYAEAFAAFEASNKHLDKLQTWKDALKEAANHSGYSSLETKPEALLVEEVVQEVSERLSMVCSHDNKGFIGIDLRINEIEEFLVSKDIRSVGIWGTGGIGKTTLAKAVFDKISCKFEGSCFLRNVRERYGTGGGLSALQTEFYESITGGKFIPNRDYAFENRTLQHKRLFIVFDDMPDFDPIEKLISVEGFDFLDSRSRVIVTSRNRQVLNNCEVDKVYEMEVLSEKDAIELFRRHALRGNQPMRAYEELSSRFVNRLGCLPLALKVIGSNLYKKDKKFWENSLKKLEKIVDKKIESVLKISYDELEGEQQQIFLDIAYFFRGKYKDQICRYLSYYESIEVEDEIDVLIDKSLIVKLDDNKIIIHDLLQDMGKTIERNQHVRTRLSGPEDIRNFLEKNGVRIQGNSLDLSRAKEIDLNFSTLCDIKILEFYGSNGPYKDKIKVSISKGCDLAWNALRKLYWRGCPLKSFSSKFHPVHLVTLSMRESKIEKLWDGGLHFPQLKEIDLCFSERLTSCPDLSGAPNLKRLNLSYCRSLTCIPDCFASLTSLETLLIPISKIEKLWDGGLHFPQLKEIDLSGSRHLTTCPNLSGASNLKRLDLSDCESLTCIPDCFASLTSLVTLNMRYSKIEKLWVGGLHFPQLKKIDLHESVHLTTCPDLSGAPNLKLLDLSYCESLIYIPNCFAGLTSLKRLDMAGCSSLQRLPELSGMKSLVKLDLSQCPLIEMLPEMSGMESLRYLNLSYCPRLKMLPELPSNIKNLRLHGCSKIHKLLVNIGTLESLQELSLGGCKLHDSMNSLMDALSGSCSTLTHLYLSDCGIRAIPDSLGCLSKLRFLHLHKNDFESIPTSIINLADLEILDVSNCKKLKYLPELPSTREINAANCSLLKSVHKLSVPYPRKGRRGGWSFFCFDGCVNLCPNEFQVVVEDFLGTLQSLATSWTADKLLSQYPSNAYAYKSAGMSFLGNKIPEWFSFQCMGSSITIKLPRKGEDKIFVGFVVCAVVDASAGCAPKTIPQYLCEYTLNSKDRGGHTFRGHFRSRWSSLLRENFASDYLFIGCDHSMYPITNNGDLCELCYDTEVTFEFSLHYMLEVKSLDYKPEVKSCGVHPMYAENFGNSSGSLELRETEVGNSSGSLELREMEDEPHPKRQKIQYNS